MKSIKEFFVGMAEPATDMWNGCTPVGRVCICSWLIPLTYALILVLLCVIPLGFVIDALVGLVGFTGKAQWWKKIKYTFVVKDSWTIEEEKREQHRINQEKIKSAEDYL